MTGSALILRGDALHLPLADESVDLIVTSPPYFALRSYRDGDEHYGGQLGSEPTPQAFLEALWAVIGECWRVLKPSGSCFVNLGDKRSGSGGHNNSGLAPARTGEFGTRKHNGEAPRSLRTASTRRNAPDRYNQAAFGRRKSKMLLPHRFAIGCEDGLADPDGIGWIVRGDYVWQKLNGLPESVTDRCRDSHEYLFHLVKSEQYFSAIDEVREGYAPGTAARYAAGFNSRDLDTERCSVNTKLGGDTYGENPLGKLPGSVWALPSEPLRTPDLFVLMPEGRDVALWEDRKSTPPWRKAMKWLFAEMFRRQALGLDQPRVIEINHFAAFPTELVRRVILGWSPSGVCVACGEGRRPVVDRQYEQIGKSTTGSASRKDGREPFGRTDGTGMNGKPALRDVSTITGYACACPFDTAPTRPSVILDPFLGSGTTTMVARALGRAGIGTELSADYCRLAKWRTFDSGGGAKAVARTNREAQGSML